jgi:hypothetical protein
MEVTAPIDPKEGRRYIELVKDDEIDNLDNLTIRMDDYVNLTIDGTLSWRSIN